MNEKKEQELKPVVCVMNPDDIHWMKENFETSNYSDCLLTPYQVQELSKTRNVKFPAIRENAIFMLDPLEGRKYYERSESTDADIVEKRINAIIVIVSLLGGKEFRVLSDRKSLLNKGKQVTADAKLDISKKVKIDSNTEVDLSKGLSDETTITAKATFEGVYTEKNYYKAVALAEQYALLDDPTIKNFLTTRHPDNPNSCIRQAYQVSTCKDLKENLKVAEKLKVDVKDAVNVEINVNVNTSHDERYIEIFEFEVEFGPVVRETTMGPSHLDQINVSDSEKKFPKWIFWIMGGVIAALTTGLLIVLL